MEFHFSPYEIAEMAISIEEEGVKFYTVLAESASSEKLKGIFSVLAKAEATHKEKFREIANANREEDDTDYSIDISMLMHRHIEELKNLAFKFSAKIDSEKEALKMALDIERTAIKIYTDMKSSFIAKFHGILSKIIDEENKHLEIVEKALMGIGEK